MKKFMLLSTFLFLSSQLFSIEDSEKPVSYVQLEESIISESNFENDVNSTPKNVTVITEEEFKEKGAKTVADALKTAPGVIVRTLTGGEPSFDMRGQGDNAKSNVVVLLDGTPLNSIDSSGYRTSNIPLDQVERIEIIPGGGGVLYGDGAVAGMINIITKSPKNQKNYGSIGMEAGSYDLFKYNVNYGTAINDRLFMKLDYTDNHMNGYRDYSESNLGAFSSDFLYLLDDGSIDFKFSHSKDDFKMPGSLSRREINDHGRKHSEEDMQQKGNIETNIYNLKYTTKLTKNLEFLTYMDYSEQDYKSDYPFYGSKYNYETEKFYIKPHLKYSYAKDNYFIAGADYLNGKTDVTEGFSKGEREKESEGAFVINRFYLDKFQFTQGYRRQNVELDYIKTNPDYTYSDANDTLKEDSKEFSISYLYSDTGSVYFNYLSAFRTPNTDELAWWVGDVDAQNSDTYEIGTKDMIGDTFYSLSTFYIKTDDEIVYAEAPNGDDFNFNLDGETERLGAEIFFEHYFDKFTLRESYTYMKADIVSGTYDGSEMPGVPEHKGTIGATYDFTKQLKINTDVNYVGKTYDSSDFENKGGKSNTFVTVDLNLNYAYSNSLDLYGGVKNLFDREYYDYIGGFDQGIIRERREHFYYPANGRNFYVGFKKSF